MKPPKKNTPKGRKYSLASTTVSLGLNMAVAVILFTFIGYKIDQKRGGDLQIFTLLGVFLGLFYGGYEVWKAIQKLN